MIYDRFKCGECNLLAYTPIQCSSCDKLFCKPCFDKLKAIGKKCSQTNGIHPLNKHFFIVMNAWTKRLLEKQVSIFCPYNCRNEIGDWLCLPYSEAIKHIDEECPKNSCERCRLYTEDYKPIHETMEGCLSEAFILVQHLIAREHLVAHSKPEKEEVHVESNSVSCNRNFQAQLRWSTEQTYLSQKMAQDLNRLTLQLELVERKLFISQDCRNNNRTQLNNLANNSVEKVIPGGCSGSATLRNLRKRRISVTLTAASVDGSEDKDRRIKPTPFQK